MSAVTLSVPASAANLGPGFDSLGLALALRNTLQVRTAPAGLRVMIEGEGRDSLPVDASNLIVRAMLKLYRLADRPAPGLELLAHNHIPLAAGLGSSAAAIVCGLAAADALLGLGLPRARLLQLAAEMEGHADNAAAALFGGLTLVLDGPQGPMPHPLPLALSQVVVVTPELRLATADMRRALPRNVPLEEAVFNLSHTALLLEALRAGDPQRLSLAMQDRLHEPYRARFIPGFEQARQAGLAAGAAGVALSGAGPSLLAFAVGREAEAGQAMVQAFAHHGLAARWQALPIDRQGLLVEAASEQSAPGHAATT
jgi:homoserine kinase